MGALKTAKKNVNELGKQERKLEAELRKMQHSHTQELEAMQKEYEKKKRTMEEQIAKAKITHLRLQQEAKLLQIRMKKGGEDGPSKARLSALLNELNKGDKNQNKMRDDYNQMILQHKENSRAFTMMSMCASIAPVAIVLPVIAGNAPGMPCPL